MMKKRIIDYIDFEKVNVLLEGFNKSTGFVTAILDLEGNVLSKSGWRQICTSFHRVHHETAQRCIISDTVLAGKMNKGEKYHSYKCLNGLVDVAVPIIIKGEHIANLFSGQFFFEKPDKSFFQKQAKEFGFNEEAYLKVLEEVPVISEEKVETIMAFLLNMTQLISDMTFQKLELMNLNNALQKSEERYRLVLENSIDAIILASTNGRIIAANQSACNMFQCSEEEICQISVDALLYSNDNRYFALEEERNRTGKVKGELQMLRKDGSNFPVELSSSIFADQSGTVQSSMIIRDVTESKNNEEQLIIAKEKAEESDRLKTAFLQNMSHEIRTPMNAIMGFSDLLLNNFNDKNKLKKFSNIIRQRCNDLLDIINDILDISKIESGQLTVNNEVCDLKELFAELNTFFVGYQNRLNKQRIAFSLHAFADPSANLIITDTLKLKQIFINLISNAFKFTNSGSIEGGCKLDENNNPVFYVSDTGVGIPLEKQQLIYTRFTQLHHASTFNTGGTGLGLSIVKGMVGVLGGQIFLESIPEKGSTFSFTIPYQTAERFKKQRLILGKTNFNNFSNKSILIVEDDLYNAEYLKEVLSGYGFNLVHTEYGCEAVDISLKQNIDIILMDIRLPDINGYEATRRIKQSNSTIKIIAQTAYAAQDEKEKAIEAGCIDYISKPTKKDLLLTLISKQLTSASSA